MEDGCVRSLQRRASAIGSGDKRTRDKCSLSPGDKRHGPRTCPHSFNDSFVLSLRERERERALQLPDCRYEASENDTELSYTAVTESILRVLSGIWPIRLKAP